MATPAFAEDAPLPPSRPSDLVAPESHGSSVDLDIPRLPPLPPPRPVDLATPVTPVAPVPVPASVPAPPSPTPTPRIASDKDVAACTTLLGSGAVVAHVVPPIHDDGECGIDAPVVLEAVVLSGKRTVAVEPAPTMRCDLAAALARFVSEDIDPMLVAQNLTLQRVTNADAYSCRGRNRVPGAKLSEHGKGNAIDLDALIVAPARRIPLTGPESTPVAALLRAAACARFATVLGPGSDGYHETHIHLDLEDRRTHGTLCQWRLP